MLEVDGVRDRKEVDQLATELDVKSESVCGGTGSMEQGVPL